MKLQEAQQILNCRVLAGADRLEQEAEVGCGADLMSDVLAFIKPNALLLTGLTNVQSVRAADIAGVKGMVYVRGKTPDPETVQLALEKGIVLLATDLPMYEACGRLYARGLRGGSECAEGLSDDRRATVLSKV